MLNDVLQEDAVALFDFRRFGIHMLLSHLLYFGYHVERVPQRAASVSKVTFTVQRVELPIKLGESHIPADSFVANLRYLGRGGSIVDLPLDLE